MQSDPEQQKRKVERFNSTMKRRKTNDETNFEYAWPVTPSNPTLSSSQEGIVSEESDLAQAEEGPAADIAPPKDMAASFCEEKSKLFSEMKHLREERDKALALVGDTKARFLSFYNVKSRPKDKFKYYTGLTAATFELLLNFLRDSFPEKSHSRVHLEDQFLMTLVKLCLNIQFENLADQFNCTKSHSYDIFKRWIDLLYLKLRFLINSPDHDAAMKTLPNVFRQYFPRLTHIIDCTELFIDRPKNLKARAQVYSNYKKHSTTEFFIACTP